MNNKTVEQFDRIVSEMCYNLIQRIFNNELLSIQKSTFLCFVVKLIVDEIIDNSDKLLKEITEM